MQYDKASFLAGLAVGRRLKGWASGGDLNIRVGKGGELSSITVRSQPTTFIETPAEGFYGIGSVTVEGDEHLVPQNIKYGVSILGIAGSYAPADPVMQAKSLSVTQNGAWTVRPDGGYGGLSQVRVSVDVPTEVVAQAKSVVPKANAQTVVPDSGYNALSKVVVSGDVNLVPGNIRKGVSIFGVVGTFIQTVAAVLQSKTVTPGAAGKTVRPDSGYDALSSVYVAGDSDLIPANIREGVNIFGVTGTYSTGQNYQTKSVLPGRNSINVAADAGYDALARVTVQGDSALVPGNIAKGVSIFGVKGTFISPMKPITVIPSADEQYIIPAEGFCGFSSVTVAPAGASGDYSTGFADGAASRDAEVAELEQRVLALTEELEAAYQEGYADGYDKGASDVLASMTNGDEVSY